MADEKILIEGKEYISSGRAAKIVGYTKDYVGQLARDGKITAKRIGRNWYIKEDSITKHKLSVHYVLTKPKKSKVTEKNTDEKPNKNIDNTVTRTISADSKDENEPATVLSENVLSLSDNHDDVTDESYEEQQNFLPPLQKKNSQKDVLLHTDIRYETYPPPQVAKHSIPSNKLNSEHISFGTNREQSIEKPSQLHSQQRVNRERRVRKIVLSPHAIDGVMTPGKRIHRTHVADVPEKNEKVFSERIPHNIQQEESVPVDDTEVTKTVPVIGAIVLFTVFILVYIFFAAN